MLPTVTDPVAWSVTLMIPAKNGSTDRDAVWVEDSGGPKERCIRWDPDPLMGKGNFEGGGGGAAYCIGYSALSCLKTAEPIEMPFGIWNHVLYGVPDCPMRRPNF